jgi:hypothetical protein
MSARTFRDLIAQDALETAFMQRAAYLRAR